MRIGVIREEGLNEYRVALIPEVVKTLIGKGIEVIVESQAGVHAFHNDEDYTAVGAVIAPSRQSLFQEVDLIATVQGIASADLSHLRPGQIVVGFLNPLGDPRCIQQLAERGVTALAVELVPRTSRAQSMDALSSQASIAGYKAVLLAAAALPKYVPMLTTAAGTIRPAKVVVLGAGVAGLQAIATARRLGATVEAYDIRPAVREEVQSLGAHFIDVTLNEETTAVGGYAKEISEAAKEHARAILTQHIAAADVVITTAQVPGRKAPVLVTEAMVSQMRPGSVVVDLASEQGGNCEGSEAGKDVRLHGVLIMGPLNLPSTVAVHASQSYAKNLLNLIKLLIPKSEVVLDFGDDIFDQCCLTHGGEIRNQRVRDLVAQLTNV
ncbi:MAG: Re/Si-specific NAD(P)(+) transhydrogenase subunit alpha [Oscillatoriales cyanobacterium SM2_2_1]|nr:Re/Si-specific NAD(P)(+) transhydrogenase subunit alpha [Oscillatoriales cyanobacterium SM2_2_1]